jgi:hypothetical protein
MSPSGRNPATSAKGELRRDRHRSATTVTTRAAAVTTSLRLADCSQITIRLVGGVQQTAKQHEVTTVPALVDAAFMIRSTNGSRSPRSATMSKATDSPALRRRRPRRHPNAL